MISSVELQHLVKRDLKRNLGALFAGSSLPLIINLAALPILSRLYSPIEFGEFALYFALAQIAAVFISGNYEYALLHPKKNSDSLRVMVGGLVLSVYLSVVVLVAVYAGYDRLVTLFQSPFYASLVWGLPLVGLILALRQILTMWIARRHRYTNVAAGKVTNAALINGLRAPRYIYSSGAVGLWFGFIVSEVVALFVSIVNVLKHDRPLLRAVKLSDSKEVMQRYSSYPALSMPLSFLNQVSANLLVFLFAFSAALGYVGLYDRFAKLVSIPMDVVSGALGVAYYEKVQQQRTRISFLKGYVVSLVVGSLLYLPLMLFGPQVFSLILGEQWAMAGTIAQLLAPLMILSFATKCIKASFAQEGDNVVMLIWQIAYIIIVGGWIVLYSHHSLLFIVKIYALLGAVMHLLLGFYALSRINVAMEEPE